MVVATLGEELALWMHNRLGGIAAEPIDFVRALASSPFEWLPPSARVVFRADFTPVIGLVGEYAEKDAERFRFALRELREAIGQARVIDHQKVEPLAERLATKLIEEEGGSVAEYTAVAVPRGGLFVLGYLSYMLPGLSPYAGNPQKPLLLVDDAAYSGRRLTEWIDHFPNREIVVATLLSAPQVREAISKRYGSKVRWINAEDLSTYGSVAHRSDEQDLPPWQGRTEHCCFPWSETDRGLRLHGTAETYTAFRLSPIHFCLKNRSQFETNGSKVSIAGNERGWIRSRTGVLWANIDDRVYLADTTHGRSMTLSDTAAAFWMSCVTAESRDDSISRLSNKYGVERSRIATDLDRFASEMIGQEVLSPSHLGMKRALSAPPEPTRSTP